MLQAEADAAKKQQASLQDRLDAVKASEEAASLAALEQRLAVVNSSLQAVSHHAQVSHAWREPNVGGDLFTPVTSSLPPLIHTLPSP